MPFEKGAVGRGRRAVRARAARRTVELLERRDLLALVVAPLALTEDVYYGGTVATFAGTDLSGTTADFTPTVTWGDGTASSSTSTTMPAQVVADGANFEVIAPKTYTEFGTFPLTVSVADSNGTQLTANGTATVADAPLTPSNSSFTATEGQQFSGVVGSFLDVNPSSVPSDFSIRIYWGDGQSSLGTAVQVSTAGPGAAQRFAVTGTHLYSAVGTDTVTVAIVRSSSGQTITDLSTANVIAPNLNLFPATLTGVPGQPLSNVALATLVDSNPTSSAANFLATIQWGPGLATTSATVTPVAGQPGQYTLNGTFTYPNSGTFNPVVTVTRTTLNQTVQTTSTVDIAASTPVALGTAIKPTAGTQFQGAVATFTDSAAGSAASDFTATIQWTASGTTTPGTIVATGSGQYAVNGTYTYTDANDGPNPATITITRTAGGQTATATTAVVVSPSLTTIPVANLTMTIGQPFNGTVATFLDGHSGSVATNFSATIAWGDGQTSAGMIVPVSGVRGEYNVVGTHLYNSGVTSPFTVLTTITRLANGQSVTASTTASLLLAIFPATVSGAPGVALTNVTLATLVDTNTTSSASNFSATIQWGPGLATTTATITPVTGQAGQYTVNGTFTYPTSGTFSPVVTVTRTTLNQTVSTTSTVDIAAPTLVGASRPVAFTGGFDPLNSSRVLRGVVVTNVQEPILSGTATPGSSVSLTIRRLGLGDPIAIGETVADPTGHWSLVVGPLGGPQFLLFGVETPVSAPPSPITLLNNGLPILVTNQSLRKVNRLLAREAALARHQSHRG